MSNIFFNSAMAGKFISNRSHKPQQLNRNMEEIEIAVLAVCSGKTNGTMLGRPASAVFMYQ